MKEGSRTAAVVLAAGTSTRMGAVKQLLPLEGRPLLQHVLDTVRESGVDEIILVLGYAADRIKTKLELQNVRVVLNDNYRQGMGSSLKVGLSAVDSRTDAALIILADQPFVRSATLEQLMIEHQHSMAQIVIPTYRGFRGNPVLLDRSVFPEIMGLDGDLGCRAIFGHHQEGIVKLPVDDVGILLDIDRQDDLKALRRAGSRAEMEKTLLEAVELQGRQLAEADPSRPQLVIVGRDAIALALVKLGQLLRFTVTLVDPLLTASQLPGVDSVLHVLDFSQLSPSSDRHVVIASRGTCDEEAIEQALHTKSAYVALVANRKRGEEVLRGVRMKAIAAEDLASVRIPAGLEIGARSPEEIALSIMAQIVAERSKSVPAA
jgi:molybdenum cofactor cytidylyltransferase